MNTQLNSDELTDGRRYDVISGVDGGIVWVGWGKGHIPAQGVSARVARKAMRDFRDRPSTPTARRDFYSGLARYGVLRETIKSALAKWQARQANRPPTTPTRKQAIAALFARRRRTLPLNTPGQWNQLGEERYPRRRNWVSPASTSHAMTGGFRVDTIDNGRYSSRCTYTHYTYRVVVTAYAVVLSPQRLRWRLAEETGIRLAPHGYHWAHDSNGVKLVANANPNADYHPYAEELRDESNRELASKLRDNYQLRQQRKREEAAKRRQSEEEQKRARRAMRQAEKEGLAVCVADSARAGNCRAGTVTWAQRHGLDPQRHYTPSQLLAQANGDAHRVTLVIQQALRRHRREMDSGVCHLEEHK